MIYNLEDPFSRKKLVQQIQDDIDKFCREEFADDPRTHLGASIIGHDCQAYPWNIFRWLKFEEFDGRMLRLFNRGHLEEARFIRWLKGIGFEVLDLDPETKKQFRISGSKGHFGGSLDSMMKPPARYNLDVQLIILGEFKTHNEKSFQKLKKSGVQVSKPMHYRQCCSYGRAYGFVWGLYCAVNKDTDELYFEIIKIDNRVGDDLFRKADNIIFSKERPQKIAQTRTYFDCQYCTFADLCHGNAVPTVNCRSCINATPVDDGQWNCKLYGLIPEKEIIKGCSSWSRIA